MERHFLCRQGTVEESQCVANTKSGDLLMYVSEKNARTVTETLTAAFFLMEHIQKTGYTLSTVDDSAQEFIANRESEKYRKSIRERKG